MRLRAVIRADAAAGIGAGHVMRCLALAGAMRQLNVSVTFCCRDSTGHLMDLIRAQGYDVLALPAAPLTTTDEQRADADAMIAALGTTGVNGCIVDHYGLSAPWESRARRQCGRIVVIDDLANRPHDCDVLIDFNMLDHHSTRYTGLVAHDCITLFGPKYLLLREEFRRVPVARRPRSGIDRTLVLFGGFAEPDRTVDVLRFLATAEPSPGHVAVVAGRAHPDVESLRHLCRMHGFELLDSTDNVADLMAGVDVAIAACGMTAYELVIMRVPAILVPISPIQDSVARSLARAGLAVSLPLSARLPLTALQDKWKTVAGDSARRSSMWNRARLALDGKGAERAARRLVEVMANA